jgi:hypothetical protein
MAKRIRKIVIAAGCCIIGACVVAVLLFPPAPDATATAKISEVFLYMVPVRSELAERCSQGTLSRGMTHTSLGFPDPYNPGPLVKYVTVQVANPERVFISASLEDIYFDLLVWKTLRIPAGARIVLQGTCDKKVLAWTLQETTVPNRYLPTYYRAATSVDGTAPAR